MTESIPRRLLERVSELQDAPLVTMPADDLDADRESGSSKSRGHRHRRVAEEADVPARPHPVEIVAHRRAGNLGWIRSRHVEGRDLRHRKDEVLVLLEELPALLVRLCLACQRTPH